MKHRQQGFAFILPLVVMAFAAFGLSKSWPVEAQTLPSTPAAAAASAPPPPAARPARPPPPSGPR